MAVAQFVARVQLPKALSAAERNPLEALLDEDLHYTHANGLVEDKAEFIRKLTSGERNYLGTSLAERGGLVRDGIAITFGRLTITVQGQDGPVEIAQAFTGVYVGERARLLVWSAARL